MNRATLAVAGSRKTQSIVEACSKGPTGVRRLALTFTQTGQAELEGRLHSACPPGAAPEVMGWYAFLLRHCVRPYLPLQFSDQRLRGLNFEGDPGRYASGVSRFFDAEGRAYRLHLSKLAYEVSKASKGAVVDRIAHIYDEIYIDEVQDLTGCDLHIVEQLMNAADLNVHMVGDVRQSVFDTNPQDPNLKQYRGVNMLNWFELHQKSGLLEVTQNAVTWRATNPSPASPTHYFRRSSRSTRQCPIRTRRPTTTACSRSQNRTSQPTCSASTRSRYVSASPRPETWTSRSATSEKSRASPSTAY